MDKSKTDNIKILDKALKNGVTKKVGSYLFKSSYVFFLLIFMSCNSQQKNMPMKDPAPYLHELDSNSNYEVKTLVSEKLQISDPDDYENDFQKIFFDKTNKNIIVKSRTKKSVNQLEIFCLKIDAYGDIISKTKTLDNIINNGVFFSGESYSNWIIDGDSTKYKTKPFLSDKEKNNIQKWLPKFKEAYHKASFVYVPTGLTKYYILIDSEWYLMDRQEDTPKGFKNQYPAKNPLGRMMVLEDITPDFLSDTPDTSLIELLGYGQEYFEEGEGMNPINGSADHYYFALKMKNDTLKFKRFGTMHPNLWVYKIPEELGGHPDVVFIVQEYNRMFPNQEFGGMYVVRPKGISKSKVD